MAIYVVGGISTAIFCWSLIEQYSLDKTQFNVAVLFNKSIILPDAKLCFDISNRIPYAPNATQIGKEMFLSMELKYIFDKQTSRETFLDPKQNWSESLLFITCQYISMMTQYEIQNSAGTGLIYNIGLSSLFGSEYPITTPDTGMLLDFQCFGQIK
jgi:hypothetical protein